MNNNAVDTMPLTILTPTYNREKTLVRLYKSLLKQNNHYFQWLVIDDGSTDNTEGIMNRIMNSTPPFNITYVKKNNGGKHSALNYSHKYILGKYLVIVDSDDYLSRYAVDIIIKKWNQYSKDKDIAGITFQRGTATGDVFDNFVRGEYISDFATEVSKGLQGDHCETVKADCFKNFMFPIFKNERFIAEGAMWYCITKNRKIVYSDKIIYYGKYLDDGLTKKGRRLLLNNPKGAQWHARVFLNPDFSLKIRIKNALLFSCYSILQHEKINSLQLKPYEKTIVTMSWPYGLLLCKYWKYKYIRG